MNGVVRRFYYVVIEPVSTLSEVSSRRFDLNKEKNCVL